MKQKIVAFLAIGLCVAGCSSKTQEPSSWAQKLSVLFEKAFPSPQQKQAAQYAPAQPQEPVALPPQEPVRPVVVQQEAAPVQAVLFVHSQSPLCQQLLQDQWATRFGQQYQGKVELTVYDLQQEQSKPALQNMMRQYRLQTLTVPTVFIGDSVLGGYPFEGVEAAVQKALVSPRKTANKGKTKNRPSVQVMEITMEDEQKEVPAKSSKQDYTAMKRVLAQARQDNQVMLRDIAKVFDNDTYAQAFAIVIKNERELTRVSQVSPDLKTYLNIHQRVIRQQDMALHQLMKNSAGHLRAIKPS